MARRLTLGCFLAALLVLPVLFDPENAEAWPFRPGKMLASEAMALRTAFRGGGHSFFRGGHGGRHRGFAGRSNRSRPFRHFLARRRNGLNRNRQVNSARPFYPRNGWRERNGGIASTNRDTPARSQPAGGNYAPERPSGGRTNWTWNGTSWSFGRPGARAPGIPNWPSAAIVTVLGAGGNDRPPIAPRYFRGSGQPAAQAAAAMLANKRYRPREILVEVPIGAADSLRQTLEREYNVTVRDTGAIELVGARIWHIQLAQGQDLRSLLERLLQDNRVLTAQPNYVYTPVQGSPEQQRPSGANNAARAHPSANRSLPTGSGVKLAVIDTCIERNHAELQGSIASSYDAIKKAAGGCQPENHGTAVASLIAGHSQLHGTAAGAVIMPARAFAFTKEENEVAATSQDIVMALNWAAQSDARIMNLSFAGPADSLIERTVAAAYRRNIVLVAAAGNAGPASAPLYPAAYPEVIAVSATNGKRQIYSASNRGKYVAISARGVDVLVAHVNNSYATESGTSFAAAEVSGVVACLLEKRPKASPDDIRAALQKTATSFSDIDSNGAGYGIVNAFAAISFVETSVPR